MHQGNENLLDLTAKLIANSNVTSIAMHEVPPEDERIKCQMSIIDCQTSQTFGLMANTEDDVKSLLPKLLDTLIQQRKIHNA